ncbi:hypothetical protein [Wenzhouxiangella sp. EGI_FJ10409]|uniref:hypothetical protein n=1 Tax=Wenzhouxiangella sp. EGI_FJ10409 TaxID=3243767 RepID=UPI0035D5C046
MDFIKRNALLVLVALCAVTAVAGLFFRADKGAESLPLLYPLLGVVSVGVAVLLARALAPLLGRDRGDDNAD